MGLTNRCRKDEEGFSVCSLMSLGRRPIWKPYDDRLVYCEECEVMLLKIHCVTKKGPFLLCPCCHSRVRFGKKLKNRGDELRARCTYY